MGERRIRDDELWSQTNGLISCATHLKEGETCKIKRNLYPMVATIDNPAQIHLKDKGYSFMYCNDFYYIEHIPLENQ